MGKESEKEQIYVHTHTHTHTHTHNSVGCTPETTTTLDINSTPR